MNFGEIIKTLRLEENLSQFELSQKTGISQSAIAKWEKGQREPVASNIVTLCDYFHVTADYLLGRTDY